MAKSRKILNFKKRFRAMRTLVVAAWPGAIVLLAYQIIIKTGVYENYPWLDNPLHLLGAAAIAWGVFVGLNYLRRRKLAPKLPFWLSVVFVVGCAAIIGIFWELYEFLLDLSRGGWQPPPIADTLKDLTNDLLGSFIGALIIAKWSRSSKQ